MGSQQSGPRGSSGALGANYNEGLTWINHDELRSVHAPWIRGFIDMHQTDCEKLDRNPNLQSLLQARDAGFKTILSLKWPYAQRNFPAPGSDSHRVELARLDRVLCAVMGRVDILVVGNEPFIEAQPGHADERLNVFYETLADAVIAFRRTHSDSSQTRLYMGALNRLDQPAKRTPAIQRFLHFIASRPDLDGVDLHLHMPTLSAHRAMLEYVLPRLRPDQTFLATEFSMVWHWKKHMGDAVSPAYCARYGVRPGTKVHEVITQAMAHPVELTQWEDFLRHEPWYMECRHFLTETMRLYRATGRLVVATYSFCPMRNRKRALLEGDTPWMLNGVYAPSTVRVKSDGGREENFPWAEEFRRAQR